MKSVTAINPTTETIALETNENLLIEKATIVADGDNQNDPLNKMLVKKPDQETARESLLIDNNMSMESENRPPVLNTGKLNSIKEVKEEEGSAV